MDRQGQVEGWGEPVIFTQTFSSDEEKLSFDDEVSLYLAGFIRGGPGWHFCYIETKGSWKNDSDCSHQ